MNKIIKRSLLLIITTLIMILGFATQSNALTQEQIDALNSSFKNDNATIEIHENQSYKGANALGINDAENVFCIQGYKAIGWGYDYKVTHRIDIVGNKATIYSNANLTKPVATVENRWNLVMAYVMNQGDGYSSHGLGQNIYSTKQLWTWDNFGSYKAAIGHLDDVNFNEFVMSVTNAQVALNSNAQNYANNYDVLSQKAYANDKTDKDKVSLASVTSNNEQYYRVGPFNWEFNGDVSSVSVYDLNNKSISASKVKYGYYAGNEIQIKDNPSEAITNKKNFYVLINKKEGIEGISKVKGKFNKKYTVYKGTLWTLKYFYNGEWPQDNTQQMIATVGGTETQDAETEVTTSKNVHFLGKLRIIKASSVDRTERLAGAEFILRISGTDKYLSGTYNSENGYYEVDSTKTLSIDEAAKKPFKTGKAEGKNQITGYADIIKIPQGKYDIIETKAPEGYFLASGTKVDNKHDYVICSSEVSVIAHDEWNGNMEDFISSIYGMVYSHSGNGEHIEYGSGKKYSSLKVALHYAITGKATGIPSEIKGNDSKEIINSIFEYYSNSSNSMEYDLSYSKLNKALEGMKDDQSKKEIVQDYIARIMSRWRKGNDTAFKGKDGYVLALFTKCYGWQSKVVWNKPQFGDIRLKKVDKNNEGKVLNGVGFIFKCTSSDINSDHVGKYVTISNGKVVYQKTPQQFITGTNGEKDNDGQIYIQDVDAGTYDAIETSVGDNAYYDIEYTEEKPLKITVKPGVKLAADEAMHAPNTQKYINLSGYVWEEIIKQYSKDETYSGKYEENVDKKLANVPVTLWKSGGKIKTTVTDKDGSYRFGRNLKESKLDVKIEIDDLDKYYVTFDYNGITYQVVSDMEKITETNTNKCYEATKPGEASIRNSFNDKFATIDGDEENKTSNAISSNGSTTSIEYTEVNAQNDGNTYTQSKVTYGDNLLYGNEEAETANWPISGQYDKYTITSTTQKNINTGDSNKTILGTDTNGKALKLADIRAKGITEITNINLGLYRRQQTDISLSTDVKGVNLTVNGYEHAYAYNRISDKRNEDGGSNMGVYFGSDVYKNQTYERKIYESDLAEGVNFSATITYRITVNQANELSTTVNKVTDCYDKKYSSIMSIGTDYDKNTFVAVNDNNITYESKGESNGYNKIEIDTSKVFNSLSEDFKTIYITFKIDQMKDVYDASGDTKANTLSNFAEVKSYSSTADGKTYAAIDADSRPSSSTIGNTSTYEDDAFSAPGFVILLSNARQITGTVFKDEAVKSGTGNEHIGNGIYDDKTTISGVKVALYSADESNNITGNPVGTTTYINGQNDGTGTDGTFTISGFIPGKYKLVYTWGDGTYTVQDYKGTIYVTEGDHKQTNNKWYQYKADDTRYSDALDNYNTRLEIDKYEKDENEKYKITTMNSTTPAMDIGVEISDTELNHMSQYEDVIKVTIPNVDFGIIERANQELNISKRATAIKITDNTGSVLVDAVIDADGKLSGNAISGVTYMKPSDTTIPYNGYINSVISSEYLAGSTADITYEIKVENVGEKDFDSENYYLYGDSSNAKEITLKANVYDYLSKSMALDEEQKGEWTVVTDISNDETTSEEIPVANERNEYTYTERINDTEGNEYLKTVSGYESFKSSYKEYNWETDSATEVYKTEVGDRIILQNPELNGEIKAGKQVTKELHVQTTLSDSDEIDLNNDVDIREITYNSKTGKEITPNKIHDRAETVIITPPTGENHNYAIIIAISISALIILGTGVIFIKKKVIK